MDNASALDTMVAQYGFSEPIYVTRPTMPSLEAYTALLEGIWDSRWLTNDGALHTQLEQALCAYLATEHLSLFCNGTIALLVALQALGINEGEVITTPFTFPATPHVLHWNRVQPVFCDIDPATYNLDATQIEACITPDTRAILGVHVYGTPCDVDAIDAVAQRHGLRVIYDAAHAFGIRYRDRSLADYGDMAVLSFHATKLFSTGEGGALISHSSQDRRRVNHLKNFGIAGEEAVIGPGINGKMSEFQAAFGLLQLENVDAEIANRRAVAETYRAELAGVPGLTLPPQPSQTQLNYAYFPILVDPEGYSADRDTLHATLKRFNVVARKYFHLLCSRYACYAGLPSAEPANLPVAERIAREVLCLPIYGTLSPDDSLTIARIIAELPERVFGNRP